MRAFLIVALGIFLAGCAAAPTPDFNAREKQAGAVRWRGPAGSGEGAVTCETDRDGNFRVRVLGNPARLTVQRAMGRWTMAGPLAGRRWDGADSAVPAKLEGWLSFAEACEGGRAAGEGRSEVRTGRFSVRYAKRDGRLEWLELVSLATGERFLATFWAKSARSS